MKKVMLIYPTGEIYQRGEDRCQINVKASSSNSLRACNDLGYIAAILKQSNYSVFLKDYPAENLKIKDLLNDIIVYKPDVVIISTTNGSILNDITVIKEIKEVKNDITVILKGAVFFNPDNNLFNEIDLSQVDYLIGGEVEFIIKELLYAHFNNKNNLKDIQGICYKENNLWKTNPLNDFNDNIDEIPFPDRSLMNNKLYINPLTNKPMATISTSRGCPSSCIYCLSPLISGKKVRFRSSQSVFEELTECVNKYNITDFFFKSDTFTINKQWAIDLCDKIINSELKNKINWVANSRTDTIDEELIIKMKEAGCILIALGIESGSNESLIKMKKGTTVEQNINAVKLIKKHNLPTLGFYIIGFPWETQEHINATEKLMFDLDTDFIELSAATPFKGSELYKMTYKYTNNGEDIIGKDSFKYTANLTEEKINRIRKKILLKYHTRPKYIIKKVFNKKLTPSLLFNYFKYGIRLIINSIK